MDRTIASRRGLALALALLLPACSGPGSGVPPPGPAAAQGESGIGARGGAERVVSQDAHRVVTARVLHLSQDGRRHSVLMLWQRWEGVHRPAYTAAHAARRALPYRRMTGARCPDGTCLDLNLGLVALSPALWATWAETGLSAVLTGPAGRLRIAVPPEVFLSAGPVPD